MRQTSWLLLVLLLVVPGSAQTPSNPPRAPVAQAQPTGPQPAPTTPTTRLGPENLVTFDYRQAEVRWIDQRWQLIAGEVWLKDFGRRETDARTALRTIQNLRLTQRGTVGAPVPVMEYWLADGTAPAGWGGAGRVEPLDLSSLRVELVDGQWSLRDNRHRLFAFGAQRADAEQALAVIQHYGFAHLGAIGPLIPTMTYFLGGDRGMAHSPLRTLAEIKASGTASNHALENGTQPAGAKSPEGEHPPAQPGALAPSRPAAGQQAAPSAPQRLVFDYRQVQIRRDQNDWKLVFGGYVFANFGADHYTAQQALSLIQYYRFTEQFLIGRPVPTLTYFLVGGQAPRGLKFGLPAEAFFPDSVVVRQVGGQWVVCEGDRPLVSFGDKEDDARQLAAAIHRYRFDHLCRLGSGAGQSLTFLVRAR